MNSFISSDNTWALWTVLAGSAALAIYLEQRYKWANKVTGCILALLFAMILSNLNIIPAESPVYDNVWGYVVPLAVPMLLFNANIRNIGKDSGRILIIYLISGVGTVLGGITGFFLLKDFIPQLSNIAPMFVGTYTGGSVNFVAMSESFKVDGGTVSAALVADNLLMALYFFILIAIPTINFFMKKFTHPYIDELNAKVKTNDSNETLASQYWGAKEISLLDIAMTVAFAFMIVTISTTLGQFLSTNFMSKDFFSTILREFFGNKYLLMTTFTMILATIFSKQFKKIRGSQEIGTFLIYLFFAVIGAPASIKLIITESPLLLVFAFIVVLFNMVVTFLFGKIFKFSIEECIIASNANVGGPTTAAAMAVSKGWTALIVPALLVGTLGYVIGNYYGLMVGGLFR